MKKRNLKITVPAVLYIKSILALNGIRDLDIKDILMQVGLEVDKPFKIRLENGRWLRYECEGKTISFNFDKDTLKNDDRKILTFDIVNGSLWERFGFFKPEVGKTRLSKIRQENRGSLFIKDNDVIDNIDIDDSTVEDEKYDEIINFEEIIYNGLTGPVQVVLRLGSILSKSSNCINDRYIDHLQFDISNWDDDVYYKFDSSSNKKLIEFLKKLNHRSNINIIDIYEEICSIYGLNVGNMRKNYHVNLSIKEKSINGELARDYYLEEQDGEITVRENGNVSTYTREIEHGVARIRRNKKN